MKVSELIEPLKLKMLAGEKGLNRPVSGVYVSDLLSDVMGNAQEGQVWVTMQTHRNVLGVASLLDLAAVIIVNNHQPDPATLKAANDEDIPLLVSNQMTFDVAGYLHKLMYPTDR